MLYYVFAMNYDFNEDYQYDSCVSRGICSVNPRTSSLQEVLVITTLKNTGDLSSKTESDTENTQDTQTQSGE